MDSDADETADNRNAAASPTNDAAPAEMPDNSILQFLAMDIEDPLHHYPDVVDVAALAPPSNSWEENRAQHQQLMAADNANTDATTEGQSTGEVCAFIHNMLLL